LLFSLRAKNIVYQIAIHEKKSKDPIFIPRRQDPWQSKKTP
jgi:hypothetical protein